MNRTRLSNDTGRVIARVTLIALLFSASGCDSRPETPGAEQGPAETRGARSADRQLRVRKPAVAGLFYPADERALSQNVTELLRIAPEHYIPRLKGLVCPHAGYPYSGLTAASGYRTLAGREIQTVVILAASHYAAFQGASVPNVDAYQTPLGTVPISRTAQQLAKTSPFAFERPCFVQRPSWWRQASKPAPAAGEDTPETWEHSVEVQVPFLQKALKEFSLLPVVFGEADPEQVARVLAATIGERTLVVASSDLSHYHSYDTAQSLDRRCVKAICDLNIEEMKNQEACGKLPILTLMHLARQKGWKAKLLDCRNSGDTSLERDRVVGYAAIAFYEPAQETLKVEEQSLLLALARKTVAIVATNGVLPEVNARDMPPKLMATKGCFVTLTKTGSLRGCIGHIQPQESLCQAVIHNAQNAARRDPRFPPVQPDEVEKIRIEVSVLTRPQPVRFNSPEDLLGQLEPYEDGVVLQIGPRDATFLPQVWAQIPDRVEFLNRLSQKAGCEPSAWRGKETTVFTYHVDAFEEPE